jgi:hypothetical protein
MARAATIALIAAAVLASAAAVAAGSNLDGATFFALIALIFAGAATALSLRPYRRPSPSSAASPESDSLTILRESFRSGQLGRRNILTTLRGLERDLAGDRRAPPSLDEERALMDATADAFRRWVDERLSELEAVG